MRRWFSTMTSALSLSPDANACAIDTIAIPTTAGDSNIRARIFVVMCSPGNEPKPKSLVSARIFPRIVCGRFPALLTLSYVGRFRRKVELLLLPEVRLQHLLGRRVFSFRRSRGCRRMFRRSLVSGSTNCHLYRKPGLVGDPSGWHDAIRKGTHREIARACGCATRFLEVACLFSVQLTRGRLLSSYFQG